MYRERLELGTQTTGESLLRMVATSRQWLAPLNKGPVECTTTVLSFPARPYVRSVTPISFYRTPNRLHCKACTCIHISAENAERRRTKNYNLMPLKLSLVLPRLDR